MQVALLFTSAQINLIIAIAIVFAVLFVANSVLLFIFFNKRKKSKLCTEELQRRREELLEELAQLRHFKPEEAEEDEEAETDFDDETEELTETLEEAAAEVASENDKRFRLKILAVSDMSDYMRKVFGLEGEAYDKKRYYVRYAFGFGAKLRSSSDAVKERYLQLIEEVYRYRKLYLSGAFRQERIYHGRKTAGLIFFKGKTLCVALALNPKTYENTKYRGIDATQIKRFEKTPFILKITSDRKLGYAKYLLNALAERDVIPLNPEAKKPAFDLSALSQNEYFERGFLKIAIVSEVENDVLHE